MMRLQKFLADAGVASRRQAEELIVSGQIKVNSQVIRELGTKVSENDKVEYNSREIKIKSAKIYIALNKPVCYIASAVNDQGQSVLDLVDIRERIYPVGRLDKDSSGLIILTNDGDFTNKITHASYGCAKEYEVKLNKPLADADKQAFEAGLKLPGYKLRPVKVTLVSGYRVRLILKEGINRQIRKMMGRRGYYVNDLKRIRIGKLKLGNLPEGKWKFIKNTDVL